MIPKFKKLVSLLIIVAFFLEQPCFAQLSPVYLTPPAFLNPDKFRPLHLRYLEFNPASNSFQLILDKGDTKDLTPAFLQDTTKKLMDYFLIGLTLPNESFWVNLRPDQDVDIIDLYLEKTDIGKILLEADLNLKKDLASATSPKTAEGKQYWDKLYAKAEELFGEQEVSLPTYTRPWIVPGEIIVRQTQTSAYVYKATLRIMLEQDYLKSAEPQSEDPRLKELNQYSSALIRQLIIPKLAQRVNTSKSYAPLRQVYYSLILSQWFKQGFKDKPNPYSDLINKKNLANLTSKQPWLKNTFFNQYKQSFQKGEYNESATVTTPFGQTIRQYTSGGIMFGRLDTTMEINKSALGILGKQDRPFLSQSLPGYLAPIHVDNQNVIRINPAPAAGNAQGGSLVPLDGDGGKKSAGMKESPEHQRENNNAWDSSRTFDYFGKYRKKFMPATQKIVQRIAQAYLQDADRILEVGSGLGQFGNMVREDIRAKLIQTDRNMELVKNNPVFTSKMGGVDIYRIPFKDDMIPAVVGYAALDTLYDLEGGVREIYRVLKPDGIMINFLDLQTNRNVLMHSFPDDVLFPSFVKFQDIPRLGFLRVNREELLRSLESHSKDLPVFFVQAIHEYIANPVEALGVFDGFPYKEQAQLFDRFRRTLEAIQVRYEVINDVEVFREAMENKAHQAGFQILISDYLTDSVVTRKENVPVMFPDDSNVIGSHMGEQWFAKDPSLAASDARIVSTIYVMVAKKNGSGAAGAMPEEKAKLSNQDYVQRIAGELEPVLNEAAQLNLNDAITFFVEHVPEQFLYRLSGGELQEIYMLLAKCIADYAEKGAFPESRKEIVGRYSRDIAAYIVKLDIGDGGVGERASVPEGDLKDQKAHMEFWNSPRTFNYFDESRKYFSPVTQMIVQKFAGKYLQDVDRVLEVGSGRGHFASMVQENIRGKLIQSDWSGLIKDNPVHTSKIRADVYTLPFDDEVIPAIVGFAAFDTFYNLEKAVKEMHRVLNPDGIVMGFLDMSPDHELLMRSFPADILFPANVIFQGIPGKQGFLRVNRKEFLRNFESYRKKRSSGLLNLMDEYIADPAQTRDAFAQRFSMEEQMQLYAGFRKILDDIQVRYEVIVDIDFFKNAMEKELRRAGFQILTSEFSEESVVMRKEYISEKLPPGDNVLASHTGTVGTGMVPALAPGEAMITSIIYVVAAKKAKPGIATVGRDDRIRYLAGELDTVLGEVAQLDLNAAVAFFVEHVPEQFLAHLSGEEHKEIFTRLVNFRGEYSEKGITPASKGEIIRRHAKNIAAYIEGVADGGTDLISSKGHRKDYLASEIDTVVFLLENRVRDRTFDITTDLPVVTKTLKNLQSYPDRLYLKKDFLQKLRKSIGDVFFVSLLAEMEPVEFYDILITVRQTILLALRQMPSSNRQAALKIAQKCRAWTAPQPHSRMILEEISLKILSNEETEALNKSENEEPPDVMEITVDELLEKQQEYTWLSSPVLLKEMPVFVVGDHDLAYPVIKRLQAAGKIHKDGLVLVNWDQTLHHDGASKIFIEDFLLKLESSQRLEEFRRLSGSSIPRDYWQVRSLWLGPANFLRALAVDGSVMDFVHVIPSSESSSDEISSKNIWIRGRESRIWKIAASRLTDLLEQINARGRFVETVDLDYFISGSRPFVIGSGEINNKTVFEFNSVHRDLGQKGFIALTNIIALSSPDYTPEKDVPVILKNILKNGALQINDGGSTKDEGAVVKDGGIGGIDFRNLPVTVQPVFSIQQNTGVPKQSKVPLTELDKEWSSIDEMVKKGSIPSGQKIKEYVLSCCQKGDITGDLEKVLACISDILRLEEDYAVACEPGFIQLLAVLESDKPAQELQLALSAVSFGM